MANTSKFSGSSGSSSGQFATPGQKHQEHGSGVADRAKDMASSAADKAKDTATSVADKAKSTASSVADKAKDTAANLGQKAQDTASNLGQKAQDMASNLGQRADDARSSMGDQMKSLAGTIRDRSPQQGMAGRAASAVASTLETSGSYLQQHDFGDMTNDMSNLVRRYPLQSVLIGIGVGFLLARATRS